MSADPSQIARAVETLQRGGVIVFPTETFYGVGCRAQDAAAVARVVSVKGRRPGKPFPVIAGDRGQAEALWLAVPDWAKRLMDAFWPGPLTIVLAAKPGLPAEVAGSGEVGVRVSPHPIAMQLAKEVGPLIATSANPSGGADVSSVSALHPSIVSAVDHVLDDGPTPGGKPSTVVTAVAGEIRVLREGPVARMSIVDALKGKGSA